LLLYGHLGHGHVIQDGQAGRFDGFGQAAQTLPLGGLPALERGVFRRRVD